MKHAEVFQAWGRILSGRAPSMSIEITRECPLRCPGCYAYEDNHLGGLTTLRQLSDHRGDELVRRVLAIVDRERPLHLSIVGGDPLVRCRELEELLPQLAARNIFVQVVTSAFRQIPQEWARIPRLNIVISIDGLQPEHDQRRKPATYERILRNIAGHQVIIHTTITGQTLKRGGYWEEFLQFWTPRAETRKIWISLFTPQRGAPPAPEDVSPAQRAELVRQLFEWREKYPKLDMARGLIQEFEHPPQRPEDCIFAQTTKIISADLKTRVTPCQFGGDPDCSQCGCVASMGLAAVGNYKLAGGLTAGMVFRASARIGSVVTRLRAATGELRSRDESPVATETTLQPARHSNPGN